MYKVTIRDHIMIAHSFADPSFGPAMQLHGATYVIDVSFQSATLNNSNVVIDIGLASILVNKVLDELRYKNLDEMEIFRGILTTTEYLAFFIHGRIKEETAIHFQGKIAVTLNESHVASAMYEA